MTRLPCFRRVRGPASFHPGGSVLTLADRFVECSFHSYNELENLVDLFDFFFPEQAQATHLRDIARSSKMSRRASNRVSGKLNELSDLQEDVKFLTLVVAALVKRLTETETLNLADLQDLIEEIDQLDGMLDGHLEPGVLRGILGLLKEREASEPVAGDEDEPITIREWPRFRKK